MSLCSVKLKSVLLNDLCDVTVVLPDPPMRTGETPREYYGSREKYKVLWLLHGGRDTLRDWAAYSSVPRLALEHGMIFVMPNGHDSDFVDHPEFGDGYLFQRFFFEELMPFIHNWFPASPAPEDNYLAGNSMGCAAAWQYGLRHPECFGCIAPLSNQPLDYRYLEKYRPMQCCDFRNRVLKGEMAVPAAYGAVGELIHTKELNAICKYETIGDFLDSQENTLQRFEEALAAGKLPRFWVPCGHAPRDNKLVEFHAYCEEHHVPGIHFKEYDGDTHAFSFWEDAIADFICYLGIPRVDYFIGC